MRTYQGIFLCWGVLAQASQAWAFVQTEAPFPSETPATAPSGALKAPRAVTLPSPSSLPSPAADETAPAPTSTQAPLAPNNSMSPSTTAKGAAIRKGKRREPNDSILKRRGTVDPNVAIVGEAQTLPKNVIRIRYILQNAQADKGYDSAGKEYQAGISLNALGHAFVAEYGLSDRLVFQMITPFTGKNSLTINANEFKKSQGYEREYQKLVDAVTPTLIANGKCQTAEQCRTAIDSGLALGIATPIELPSGEKATVGANIPINAAMDSIILKAIEPGEGKTGVGDIQFGLGYNVYSSQRNMLTLGLGLRVPTGAYTNVASAYRPLGSGFITSAYLLKYDLRFRPIIFSLSHQMEYSLTKAKLSRSSLINPKFLNDEDPTSDDPEIAGAGDGVPNAGIVERKGVYHEGFARVAFALGALTRYLKPAAVYAYGGWSIDPEYHNLGHLYLKKRELYTASYAMSLDGLYLDSHIPLNLHYKHDIAIGGRNALVAPSVDTFQLSAYYKF